MKKETKKPIKKKSTVKATKKVKEVKEVKEEEEKKEEQKKFVSYEDMSDELMNELLLELPDTIFWQAILKFNRLRDSDAIASLASVDPFKEPTLAARSQGFRSGVYILENQIVANRKRNDDEAEGKGQEPNKETQGY